MATILGLHHGHHGSACIVRDGKLEIAISTERLTRNKFCFGVTQDVLDYLFDALGITIHDIDHVALSDWNKQFAQHDIEVFENGQKIDCLWNSIYDNTCLDLAVNINGRTIKGSYIGHQLCHAAAAFYTSPFDRAFCFTLDASGAKHKNNSLVSFGDGTTLTSLYCPGLMVGVAYGFFTEYLGIGPQMLKAGSTMALASYGIVLPKVLAKWTEYVNGCFFPEDKEYRGWYGELWKDLSGSERHYTRAESDKEPAMNIAATIQFLFGEAIMQAVNNIDSGGVNNICLGGGSHLNCNINSRILLESQFNNVFLFPGCGDDGGCVGSALYAAHHLMGEPRHSYADNEICYLGVDHPTKEPNYKYLAEKLAQGSIIAWSNGRSEYGPRALGNRSLLADPRVYENRVKINENIKHREWYRPLAPVVMEDHLQDWFDFPTKSPFMLHTMQIKQTEKIPAVKHVDNSARIQSVTEETNPHYYRLIREFYNITGVPVLINTSLNGNGEPMLETDEHALNYFKRDLVDIMVLNGEIMER